VEPILGDNWREHHCLEHNLFRDKRKIVELGEQILWDRIVRAVKETNAVRPMCEVFSMVTHRREYRFMSVMTGREPPNKL
jgi:hypothetical protein